VIVSHPGQKGFGFANFGGVKLGRRDLQRRGGVLDLFEDRPPILHNGAHVGQDGPEVGCEFIDLRGIGLEIYFCMNPRLAHGRRRVTIGNGDRRRAPTRVAGDR
jgi:hypothetical protein